MAKGKNSNKKRKLIRPEQRELTYEESVQRVKDFPKRRDQLLEAIREGIKKIESEASTPLVHDRPQRVKLSSEQVLERMKSFPERKDKIIAAIRKAKD